MYGNECLKVGMQETVLGQVDRNPTVKENIDFKIARLQEEIKRLEESKVTMATFMNMHIRDIREAMNY